ncbi:MAG: hypothetical protein R3228_16120 [Halioglobus sp.]|nr:hypothetical protein [Halioglobus sp.]
MRRIGWLLLGLVLGSGLTTALLLPWEGESNPDLDLAWSEFMQGLDRAKGHLTDPKKFPAPPTDRNLAEGHRYLLGHLNRMIEDEMRADPRFPEFFRSMDMLRKWTAENPDALYLKAPIDGMKYYEVRGRAANSAAWRDSRRDIGGPQAPRMVSFATITSVPGDTGDLLEMGNCRNQTLDHMTAFDIEPDESGEFTLMIGPERPPAYKGYFLQSRKLTDCRRAGTSEVRVATLLSVREIFSNWAAEQPLELEIRRLDAVGATRPPVDSAFMAGKLRKIASDLPNQVAFWQQVQELALEVNRDLNFDGKRAMPINGINPPAPPFTAAGVAGAGQLYAGGQFDFGPDEALLITVTAPREPHYIGLQLSNLWFEGPDQQNYTSSLNGHQLPPASDGSRYFIIAHRDPGVAGWVDTTGLERGTHAMRFIFREEVSDDLLPQLQTRVVPLAELARHLPADTPRVSPEERTGQIAVRQAHIKRRWRAY